MRLDEKSKVDNADWRETPTYASEDCVHADGLFLRLKITSA